VSFIGNVLKGIIALVMIVAVIAVAAFIWTSTNISGIGGIFGSSKTTSTAAAPAGGTVMFTVSPGETVDTIADNLQTQGLIDSPFLFRMQVRLKGAANELKAGKFQLTPGMSTDQLITTLTTSPLELGVKFQVIEGMRIGEIADKLAKDGIVDKDKFLSLANTPEGAATYSDDFLKASGKPDTLGLEGYLFPDTYEIKKNEGDNSDAVIKTMLGSMEDKFTPEMKQTIADRKLDVHQVLTIASIVQREGQKKEELPVIAAVFWNRIKEGMRLDADPTTQYSLGKEGDWWPAPNFDPNTIDHPYNTYTIPGLPPGPICSPGLLAIQAAVNPDQNDYLYFVAKNDPNDPGAHAFAKTLEEHERNRVQYGNR